MVQFRYHTFAMSLPCVLPNDAFNKFQDSPYLPLKSAGSLFSRMSNISAAKTQIPNPNRSSIFHVQKLEYYIHSSSSWIPQINSVQIYSVHFLFLRQAGIKCEDILSSFPDH